MGKARRLLILLTFCCALSAAAAASAQADDLQFNFHDGVINLGEFRGEPMTDPAHPDLLGWLRGSIDPATGAFTSPPRGMYVPPRTVQGVTAGGIQVDATVEFVAPNGFSGRFDESSGALDVSRLDLNATVAVYPAGQGGNEAALLARCTAGPVPLPLSSTGSITDDSDPDAPVIYSAAPFNPNGAAVSTWESLPATTSAGGSLGALVCPMIDDAVAGPGGLWMSGTATVLGDGATTKPCKKRGKRKAGCRNKQRPKKKKKKKHKKRR